ncbi:SCO3242 family prenyltransferase [Streptomyces maremycinicus]|uniref:SCO3242 family prenyltransferase n=1 Tax=Streptomyces maremycinicus TaxID=1679753 RepID=UPI000ADD02E5|nr:UbiA family prenyltransferase [Streptomyces sp. NBRC 110468]
MSGNGGVREVPGRAAAVTPVPSPYAAQETGASDGLRGVADGPRGVADGSKGVADGSKGVADAASEGKRARARLRAWAELLRLPALFTVPGDALAGATALAARPDRRTLLAIGSSLCLYEAGMVLNDWADRAEDAAERPHRPLPSGRVSPTAAFTAACGLTAAGLALATRAGRPALAVAAPLAATVWSYDLALKHTPAGPIAMSAARGLDLLLGAAAGAGRVRPALPSAALLATHTLAVTTLSRQETREGTPTAALAALATTGVLTLTCVVRSRRTPCPPPNHRSPDGRTRPARPARPGQGAGSWPGSGPGRQPGRGSGWQPGPESGWQPGTAMERQPGPGRHPQAGAGAGAGTAYRSPAPLAAALAVAYATTTTRAYLHASLNPSPPLTQQAVGAGIRATIPLQAALIARSGSTATATATALLTAALAPVARRLARRVSIT